MDAYREATLEFAASWAEGYAAFFNRCDCGRKGCAICDASGRFDAPEGVKHPKGCGKDSRRHARDGGDFLADVVRINVDYLGQLARLNSSYTVLAARFLDRLYENVVYDHYRDSDSAAHLTGKHGAVAEARLVLCNELDRQATIQIKGLHKNQLTRALKDEDGDDAGHVLDIRLRREDGEPLEQQLKPGETANIVVSAAVPPIDPGQYRTTIKITLDGYARRFDVVLDVIT
jgi:hypothetical protein